MLTKEAIIDLFFTRPYLIQDFLMCEYRFYLHLLGISVQDDRLLKIGKSLHEEKSYQIIKVDKIDRWRGIVIEIKKKDFGLADCMQLYLYLKVMNALGFKISKGCLTSKSLKKKIKINYPDQFYENTFQEVVTKIEREFPPIKVKKPICKSCSLRDYCWG